MAKSSPEKLAKALRANLKKRKSEGRPAPKDGPALQVGRAAPAAQEKPVQAAQSRPGPAPPAPPAKRPG
jgi:hypothetical protein